MLLNKVLLLVNLCGTFLVTTRQVMSINGLPYCGIASKGKGSLVKAVLMINWKIICTSLATSKVSNRCI